MEQSGKYLAVFLHSLLSEYVNLDYKKFSFRQQTFSFVSVFGILGANQ